MRSIIKNKRGIAPILFLVITIIGIVALFSSSSVSLGGLVASIFDGGSSVYKIEWGSACCEQGPEEPYFTKYADDQQTYECSAYTDKCIIRFDYDNLPALYSIKDGVCYEIDNGAKVKFNYYETKTIYLNYGSKIKFIDCGILERDTRPYYKYQATYRPYYIKGIENGKVYTDQSCYLSPELIGKTLSDGVNRLEPSPSSPNHCQSYILDYDLVATSTYKYNFKEVICQARNIYEVDIAQLKDGSSVRIQGDRIKSVDCCPFENNCGDDFKFTTDKIRECDVSSDCANGGEPFAVTGYSYSYFTCNSGKCVQTEPKPAECTNNAICVDRTGNPSMICVDWKCKEAELMETCGDMSCDSIAGETATSCPNDCARPDDQGFNWVFFLLVVLIVVIIFFNRGKLISLVRGTLKK